MFSLDAFGVESSVFVIKVLVPGESGEKTAFCEANILGGIAVGRGSAGEMADK